MAAVITTGVGFTMPVSMSMMVAVNSWIVGKIAGQKGINSFIG